MVATGYYQLYFLLVIMQFYLVFRSDPGRRDAVPVPYVFTLDSVGKIDSVE